MQRVLVVDAGPGRGERLSRGGLGGGGLDAVLTLDVPGVARGVLEHIVLGQGGAEQARGAKVQAVLAEALFAPAAAVDEAAGVRGVLVAVETLVLGAVEAGLALGFFFELVSEAVGVVDAWTCLLYTSPSPRDGLLSRMPSSA